MHLPDMLQLFQHILLTDRPKKRGGEKLYCKTIQKTTKTPRIPEGFFIKHILNIYFSLYLKF